MMMDPGADNHVVHSRGTLSALTGRFFVTPLAKALARVGAGVAWMPGGGLYGRPPLEEARPITSPPHRAPTTDPTPPPVASAVHGRGDPLWSPCSLSSPSPCSTDNLPTSAVHGRGDPLWSPCPMSSPSSLPSPCPEHSRKSHDIFHSPTLSKHEGAPRSAQRNRLYLYPPPKPLPHTPAFKLATTLVTLLILLFSGYFIFYLTVRQNAYLTNAEDLGIMDQAIWNTLHGHLLHQSICNIVSDTNCYSLQGITRFAIHFEPILIPISLLYYIFPTPKTLLVLQTLVVASGAFPAFWLARLRLRNEWAGVAIALLYLLYPAQQNALIFDFHAVTLTSALLLFTLYFMYTRRTTWLFVFAILAMACKEEIPLVVACLGLWSMLLQSRWRSGLLLLLLAFTWTGLALLVIHLSSPTGQPLLAARYAYLGNSPPQIAHTLLAHPASILKQHLLDRAHRTFLASLLAPSGYLPLLAPWILILALPTLALNLLSSNPGMYSGLFQYNAEIVPILIFATIETMALILWLVQNLSNAAFLQTWPVSRRGGGGADAGWGPLWSPVVEVSCRAGAGREPLWPLVGGNTKPAPSPTTFLRPWPPSRRGGDGADAGWGPLWPPVVEASPNLTQPPPLRKRFRHLHNMLLALMLIYILFTVLHQDSTHSAMPFAQDFRWPHITAHTQLAQRFIDMIPPTASVSAQSRLVPHLSQRLNIYMFPYADDRANYILLDVTGDRYPYFNAQAYTREVKKVLQSGNYGILAAENGYLLLERGLPSPGVLPYSLVFRAGF